MITQEHLSFVVRAVLAQMSAAYGFGDIDTHHTLQDLGLKDESAIAEFKTRIYRTISGENEKLDFRRFYETTAITLNSAVGQVLQVTHLAVMLSLPGNDPTKPK